MTPQFFIWARAGLGILTGIGESTTTFQYRPEIVYNGGPIQIALKALKAYQKMARLIVLLALRFLMRTIKSLNKNFIYELVTGMVFKPNPCNKKYSL